MLNLLATQLVLSSSLTLNQAPASDADFWFLVTQGLLGILLLLGAKAVSNLIAQVRRLAERLDQLERDLSQRHHEAELEMARLSNRLDRLEERRDE